MPVEPYGNPESDDPVSELYSRMLAIYVKDIVRRSNGSTDEWT